jgi:hypothetical protein
MDAPLELDVTKFLTSRSDEEHELSQLLGAIGKTYEGKITYLTERGKRIAIIAPVEVGERYEEALTGKVSGRHHGG